MGLHIVNQLSAPLPHPCLSTFNPSLLSVYDDRCKLSWMNEGLHKRMHACVKHECSIKEGAYIRSICKSVRHRWSRNRSVIKWTRCDPGAVCPTYHNPSSMLCYAPYRQSLICVVKTYKITRASGHSAVCLNVWINNYPSLDCFWRHL